MLLIRVALAIVFVVAGVAKLRDPRGAQATVGAVGVPRPLQPAVAFALSTAELATAALLVIPGVETLGAVLAAALLTVFLLALGVQQVRGVAVPCACFGQIATTPAGWPTLLRNAVLLAAAVFAILGR